MSPSYPSTTTMTHPEAPVVPLPSRMNTSVNAPVWSIDNTTPLTTPKCGRTDGVCCKELIEEERTLVDPDVVRDVYASSFVAVFKILISFSVIGLSDGLTVPFALAAGLSSLGESNLVVLGGIAELIAGAISMGIGGFLASQAERDHYRYLRDHTAQRVLKSCDGEMEREISAVLAPVGVDAQTCRAVARCLREVEGNSALCNNGGGNDTENVGLKWSRDVGITAFLLKFGQGLGAYRFSFFAHYFCLNVFCFCRGNS